IEIGGVANHEPVLALVGGAEDAPRLGTDRQAVGIDRVVGEVTAAQEWPLTLIVDRVIASLEQTSRAADRASIGLPVRADSGGHDLEEVSRQPTAPALAGSAAGPAVLEDGARAGLVCGNARAVATRTVPVQVAVLQDVRVGLREAVVLSHTVEESPCD